MKKIISALAVSALVLGSAAAKTSVNLNYRNGAYLYNYFNDGEDPKSTSHTFGGLNDYNGGQDTLSLKASGDIIDVQADIQPTTKGDKGDNRLNVIKFGAKWGAFHVQAGWNGDGINGGYRVTNDAGNHEGIFFETFKLGSLFNSYSNYADNQISINKAFEDREMFAQADYTIKADDLSIKLIGTAISDRAWKKSNTDNYNNTKNNGFSVFVDVAKAKAFKVEAFVKGAKTIAKVKNVAATEEKMLLVPGLYFQGTMVDGLIFTVGGAATMYDGKLSDWSADLRGRYAIDDQLSVTYFGKLSSWSEDDCAAKSDYKIAKNVGLAGAKSLAFATKTAMWNFVNVRYAMSPVVILSASVGALTDLAQFENGVKQGTAISIHPNAEFVAGKGASITVGAALGFGGLGADETSVYGKKMDIGFAIPVLFRVKM